MGHRSYADASRDAYGCDGNPNLDQLRFGALQRIAAAVEKMATPHVNLLDRVAYLSRRLDETASDVKSLRRTIIALRGVVTRTKKRAAGKGA